MTFSRDQQDDCSTLVISTDGWSSPVVRGRCLHNTDQTEETLKFWKSLSTRLIDDFVRRFCWMKFHAAKTTRSHGSCIDGRLTWPPTCSQAKRTERSLWTGDDSNTRLSCDSVATGRKTPVRARVPNLLQWVSERCKRSDIASRMVFKQVWSQERQHHCNR